jgi:predicted DNA-binding protein (MmcQ/YjbR family)
MVVKPAIGLMASRLEAVCSRWPGVTGDIKRDGKLMMSVSGKMFALMPSAGSDGGRLSVKVADERFLEVTDQPGIILAPYLARARGLRIIESADFSSEQLEALDLDACLVRMRLTKRGQAGFGPLPTLN